MSRRLFSFFGLNEMARPKGTFDPRMKAALEKAREYGGEFTVKQFCQWLADEGVRDPHPASIGTRLARMTAKEGERPDALHPLIQAQAGRTGPGGTGMRQYALDGPAGYQKPDPNAVAPDAEDEIPYEDDEEETDAPEPAPAPKGPPPRWVPKASTSPDADWTEEAMADLEKAGFGPDSPMWLKIGKAENDIDVAKIMGGESISPQHRKKVIRVAQQIFQNLGKDWDTGNVPAARPANTRAGDRDYSKQSAAFASKKRDAKHQTDKDYASDDELGQIGMMQRAHSPRHQTAPASDKDDMSAFLSAMSKPPKQAPAPAEPDDDAEFFDADDDDDSSASQAGASQFLTPSSPTPPPPQAQRGGPAPPPSASTQKPNAKNMSQLMKRFSKK
jgi:hypothetical protein